jgi:CRISPR-associated endoribonuclease Cas6
MDLISLLLTLRPLDGDRAGGSLPTWWGRAAQALALQVFNQLDPALAQALHQGSALRPFTTSTLMGRMQEGRLDPAGSYALRFTGLTTPVSDLLAAAAQPGGALAPGATVLLDYQPFQVEAALTAGHPWAGRSSYAELAAAILAGDPPRQLGFLLASPTSFRSAGRQVPLPLPELVFGSLVDRWNAFAPLAFPGEVRRYAQECLAVARYNLRTRPVEAKDGGLRVGAVGQVSYVTLNYDRYWMGVLAALADFACFGGIGGGATTGLGQARRWQSDRPAG